MGFAVLQDCLGALCRKGDGGDDAVSLGVRSSGEDLSADEPLLRELEVDLGSCAA